MILYVVRHGDPDYAVDSLTPLGRRQAEAVGRRLAAARVDRVFSSPLGRARATAQPLCELLHREPAILDWVAEDHAWKDIAVPVGAGRDDFVYNAFPGRTFKTDALLNASPEVFEADPAAHGAHVTRGLARVGAGSDRLLAELGYERISRAVYRAAPGSDERIAVFCHEGAGMLWMSWLLGLSPHLFWSGFSFTHSAVSIFQFPVSGEDCARCLALCDTSHLYAEGLPLRHHNRTWY